MGTESYIKVSRKYQKFDTIIDINENLKIGSGHFLFMAGSCSVESEKQIIELAIELKKRGADILRGGAFKPRTSPYDFQGLGKIGLKYLKKAKEKAGIPIISEIVDVRDLDEFSDVDIVQVGARNMQNFALLKELGKIKKPVLLKRGFAATYEEFLSSAEYIMESGNPNIILCERGIRSFEPTIRNMLDITAIPLLKEMTHLPIIFDPSHGTGRRNLVLPMALAGVAAGSDGMIVEVHKLPENSISDSNQTIDLDEFENIAKKAEKIRNII